MSATLNGEPVSGADSSSGRIPSVWHQCAAPAVDPTVSTWLYGQGPVPLSLNVTDAAGVPITYTKTIDVDNSTPSVSFSGPTDAPSTAGTQYVTATAAGSPSGIDGLTCAVDGGATQSYRGATASVPVSGVGVHTVRCAAANNAVDSAGNHGWSTWQSWTLKIGVPTVSAITFDRVADALRCHTVRTRVGKRAHSRTVATTRCHPRIVWRRRAVWVKGASMRPYRVESSELVAFVSFFFRTWWHPLDASSHSATKRPSTAGSGQLGAETRRPVA